jgi:thiamine phosphate synthase YjbQ (UPF0047 family)
MLPDDSKEHTASFFRSKGAKQNATLVNYERWQHILPKHWETLIQWYISHPTTNEPSIKLFWEPQTLQIFIKQRDATQKHPMDVSAVYKEHAQSTSQLTYRHYCSTAMYTQSHTALLNLPEEFLIPFPKYQMPVGCWQQYPLLTERGSPEDLVDIDVLLHRGRVHSWRNALRLQHANCRTEQLASSASEVKYLDEHVSLKFKHNLGFSLLSLNTTCTNAACTDAACTDAACTDAACTNAACTNTKYDITSNVRMWVMSQQSEL